MSTTRPPQLIIFEGPDGVGKSTLAGRLLKVLSAAGRDFELLSLPGTKSGTLGALIYKLHHAPAAFDIHEMCEESRQLLHAAAHVDTLRSEILPRLVHDRGVILDRWWWSTWVYGRAAGISEDQLRRILSPEMHYWEAVADSVTFLIERDLGPNTSDHLVDEYARIAKASCDRWPTVVVSNNTSLEEAIEKVMRAVS